MYRKVFDYGVNNANNKVVSFYFNKVDKFNVLSQSLSF